MLIIYFCAKLFRNIDYASVLSFYNDVTEHTPEIDLYALEEGEVSDG